MISKSFSEHRQYFCNSSMNKQICLTSSLLGGLQFCAPVPSELLAEDFPILLPQCIQLLTLFMVVFISWTLFPVFLVLLSLVQMSTLKILVTYSLILRVYKPLCKDNDAKRSSFIHYPSLWLGLHSISLQQILQHHCFFLNDAHCSMPSLCCYSTSNTFLLTLSPPASCISTLVLLLHFIPQVPGISAQTLLACLH